MDFIILPNGSRPGPAIRMATAIPSIAKTKAAKPIRAAGLARAANPPDIPLKAPPKPLPIELIALPAPFPIEVMKPPIPPPIERIP